jgi:hypothetical protein
MEVPKIYKKTFNYDEIKGVGELEQHRLNDIAYPPNDKEEKDLWFLLEKDGLTDPLEIDKKDKKTIFGGHRRYRTLVKKGNLSVVPVIYIDVPEFDNDFEELDWLVSRNVKRDERYIDKYNYFKYYFNKYKDEYKVELSKEKKEYICKLRSTSYDLFKKAQKIELTSPELWKKVMRGDAVTSVYNQMINKNKPNERLMNPNTISYFKKHSDIVMEALNETATYMSFLANQERRDLEKNDGSTHKRFLNFQTNVIGAMVHEDLTKNIASILRREGKDVVALNDGLADLSSLSEKWEIEDKTALFDGTKLTFTSSKGWGAYYILLGYTHDFDRFFLCLSKVPSSSWTRVRAGLKTLTTKEIYKLSQNSKDYIQILGGVGKTKGKYHCYLDNLK